jgi:TonB family protein
MKWKWMRTTAIISAAMFAAVLAAPAAPPPQSIHVAHIEESKILHKVMPQYPPEAVDAHIHGLVKLRVMIGKDGHTERVNVISGHPLLSPAARQAVLKWIYQPTQVNGFPVHVITEIDIPFDLDASGRPSAPQKESEDRSQESGVRITA